MRRPSVEHAQAPASGRSLSPGSLLDRHFLVIAAWPSFVLMLVLTAIPFLLTMGLSLTNFNLVREADWKFVGLQNFADLASDYTAPIIIFNTAYLVVVGTILEMLLGLLLAVLMDTAIRGIRVIRTLYLVPIMVAPIVIAIVWKALLNNDAGWVDYFLKQAHLPQPVWLGDQALAMPAVILVDVWSAVPFVAVLILAGLLSVSTDLKDAARVDGAGGIAVFLNVTLPAIRPVVFIAAVFRVMELFRKFEGIQQLTGGGPGVASTTLNTQMYLVGLTYNQVGAAAAMGIVMVVMMGITLGILYFIFARVR